MSDVVLQTITNDWQAHHRVRTSYEMMLDFYGMRMRDHAKGILERAPGWRERFKCLNQSNSCHRHITRILKSLGELKYEHFKVNSATTTTAICTMAARPVIWCIIL
jgi:hypothetical protein